ncbi:MAG: hypothetical protein CMF50_00215 [Legionellales bacterium]|nr:hypothetical protein [Legionellales bacterium]
MMLAGMTLSLTACSSVYGPHGFIHDRTGEYQTGESVPPLRATPGKPKIKSDPYYIVPPAMTSKPVGVSIIPPGSLLATETKEKQAKTTAQVQQQVQTHQADSIPKPF